MCIRNHRIQPSLPEKRRRYLSFINLDIVDLCCFVPTLLCMLHSLFYLRRQTLLGPYKAELTSRVEHFNTGILSYETKMT